MITLISKALRESFCLSRVTFQRGENFSTIMKCEITCVKEVASRLVRYRNSLTGMILMRCRNAVFLGSMLCFLNDVRAAEPETAPDKTSRATSSTPLASVLPPAKWQQVENAV